MRKYMLTGVEQPDEAGTHWTLVERQDENEPEVLAETTGLSVSAATSWADRQIGQWTELEWRSAPGAIAAGSVLSLGWRATDPDPWDV